MEKWYSMEVCNGDGDGDGDGNGNPDKARNFFFFLLFSFFSSLSNHPVRHTVGAGDHI